MNYFPYDRTLSAPDSEDSEKTIPVLFERSNSCNDEVTPLFFCMTFTGISALPSKCLLVSFHTCKRLPFCGIPVPQSSSY